MKTSVSEKSSDVKRKTYCLAGELSVTGEAGRIDLTRTACVPGDTCWASVASTVCETDCLTDSTVRCVDWMICWRRSLSKVCLIISSACKMLCLATSEVASP